ncbi:MAG: 50S ribosomal protein L31 [Candidatus Pacebacteria bacterium CG10_big_fil_rev_8_21_14_0_10_56_10]|nr:MAG: 50S ribosomal protein L31 [Candidatus Pacebacteria bacterium CG10_big_fil_rev_8_21_14_0_10_56_10]
MKKGLHPQWHHDTVVTCACGHTFTTGSTRQSIQVEICSQCHPFFTGEMKFVDTQGRVDRFMQKVERAKVSQQAGGQSKRAKKTGRGGQSGAQEHKSYQQLLREQRHQLKKKSAGKSASSATGPSAGSAASPSTGPSPAK